MLGKQLPVRPRITPPHPRRLRFGVALAVGMIVTKGIFSQPSPRMEGTTGLSRAGGRSAMTELARDIDAFISDRKFADATWGISITSCETGEVLYRQNDEKNCVVASNMKLLTTATALRKLGGAYRFATDLYINGDIDASGVLAGDLVIKAGGDPSLAPEYGVEPRDVLAGWARLLDSLGIRSMQNIVVDATEFDRVPYGAGWAWDDEAYGFNAPISAASVYGNSIRVTVTPGAGPGRPVQVTMSPSTAYVSLRVTAVTSRKDSTSTVDISRERGRTVITVSGNIAAGSDPYTEYISVEQPALFYASIVKEEFERSGIAVLGQPYDATNYDRIRQFLSLRKIGRYLSPPLRDIVAAINKQSLNLGAEMLVKKLGRDFARSGTTAAGLDVVRFVLSEASIDPYHIGLFDGSGLSRLDFIAPADITKLLAWAKRSTIWRDYLASLSIAGVDGSLANRMRATLAANNVFAKTGYVNGVRAISGYARTRDGEWLAFSLVTSNYSAPTTVVNTVQDLILMRLASFSRRS